MKTKEIQELIKFNKECFELTKDNEFKVNNIRLYRELKFNTTFDKNNKLVVKDLSPGVRVNHKFKFVKEMSEEEYEEEVAIGFENNLLHN